MRRIILFVPILTLLFATAACNRSPEARKQRLMESGQSYVKKGKYPEARIEFMRAVQLDPRFVDAYYQLAQVNSALHQWGDAFAALQKTVELDSSRLDARLNLGQLYLSAQQYDSAQAEAAAILDKDPRNTGAYQLMGTALMGLGKNEDALAAFKKITDLTPQDPTAFENLALVELSLRDYPAAEQHFRQALDTNRSFAQGYENLVTFYRMRGDINRALQVVQEGVQDNPQSAPLYIVWADILDGQGQSTDSEAVLGRLRQLGVKSADVRMALGNYYLQRNEADRALLEYQAALSVSPNDNNVKNQLVEAYLDSNRLSEAEALNKEVLRKEPANGTALLERGRILLSNGSANDAIAELRRQVSSNPDSPQSHYFLGLAYWRNGDTASAQSELADAVRQFPNFVLANRSLASVYLAQNNLSAAKEYALHSVQLLPSDVDGHLLLGSVLLAQNDLNAAQQEFQSAENLAPLSPGPHFNLALSYIKQNKPADVERELNESLRLSPSFSQALSQLVDYKVSQGQRPAAIARAQEYIAANPADANGHLILGSLYVGGKQFDDGQRELAKAIQLDPKLVPAYLRLGQMSQDRGDLDTAIANYRTALALQPDFPPLITLLGNVYLDKGDLKSAREQYEHALAVDSKFAIAAANLALVQAKQGEDLNVALSLAQHAKQLAPDLDSITDTLAWIEYLKGSSSSAIPLLQECVQKAPQRPVYRYHLGMALLAHGERTEAKSQLDAALRLNLAGDDAQQARKALSAIN